ncbi:hypothetical protein CLOBY_18240 [Clostridium saccharobutylicum]|uniref:pyocin knob domain-containing protein n=1 Tax=Clostridium saccharobutylicum TaxID=169679 RepID=UPI000983A489|nr:pyocin knob domain-containing protein [Clostridium saccharobutylicum]AQS09693.1 hypothetical protein CLOBY_18240 [Clostridium saccharobutylicum]MBC2436913.1 hypothetical protein [Clostridium saccharobutylicum]NSB89261.1 hypothetical protein [Clostridium saccharobutylicum]NYC27915.1 hypothetical protein [Clostridium saccharobutylicum]OOM17112.1 hypothetical protein CLSAB_20600 [Clostridium saccharobutylicum]
MDITNFYEKYNKLDSNIYTVEEVVSPVNGVYEAPLHHDNVTKSTVNVYTGSKLTGDKINTFVLSTPSLTPWKYIIRILSDITPLYISYETIGDQVEAEDVNNVQNAVNDTQIALNDEISRATNRENQIENNLNNEITRAKISENTITNTINTNKPIWDDKYTRNEIDNKFNVYTTNLDWKESVATYADISTTYPNPDDGWTVNVKDNDITYRWDGTKWDAISANSIPLATASVDGKMSKQDKIDHDDMVSKRHIHSNKGVLDAITQSLLDTWNSAYSHISDTVRHITQSERDKWNNGVITANNANDSINDLQVGGRNLVISSQVRQSIGNSTLWNTTDSYFSLTALGNGSYKLQCTTSNNDGCGIVWQSIIQGNTTYTLKINNIVFSNTNARGLYVKFLDSSNNIINGDGSYYNISYGDISFANNGTITKQITTPNNATNALFFLGVGGLSSVGDSLTIYNIKFEKGTIATDWTPAPEDIQSQIDSKSNSGHTHDDRYYTETECDAKYATKDQISKAGYGDMLKSTYDKNGDGIVDDSDKLDGKHATDFFCSMGEISNTVDWNTITIPGCYKVQMVSWGTVSNTHSPGANFPSLYTYGLLKVYSTSVSSELRIIQEYYPHGGSDLTPRIRMHNSNDWTSGWNNWTKITKGATTWNDIKGV